MAFSDYYGQQSCTAGRAESPRDGFIYVNDGGEVVAIRVRDCSLDTLERQIKGMIEGGR